MKLACIVKRGASGIFLFASVLAAACEGEPDELGISDDEQAELAAAPCTIPAFVAQNKAPIGWAAQNGGTTGGGSATPIVVTSLAGLNSAAKGTNSAVIHVSGNLAKGTVTIGSNKTIIGCSGNAQLNGHVKIKKSSNVIVRNLNIVGYNCAPPDVDVSAGGECQDGVDAVSIEKGSKNIWVDHAAISDGSDGNLDITHGSDFITISHTKFFYSTKRKDPHDTGANGHRYSNLVGGSDSNGGEDAGRLNVTWHHNWWGQFVVERQPRIRFGKNHLFNNLWSSAGNNYCIGVGAGASVRSENNAFVGVKSPIETTKYSDGASSSRSRGDLFSSTSGTQVTELRAGAVFSPPYPFTLAPASTVQAAVQASAGPK